MKLKRSKEFESGTPIQITIEGKQYPVANLKKSGMVNHRIVLLGINESWEEVNVYEHLGILSDLKGVKSYIETKFTTFKELGIHIPDEKQFTPAPPLNQSDFERIATGTAHSADQIAELYNHLTRHQRKSSEHDLKQFLKRLSKNNQSIPDFIAESLFMEQKDWRKTPKDVIREVDGMKQYVIPDAEPEGLGYGNLGFRINNQGVVINPYIVYQSPNITISVAQLPNSLWGFGINILSYVIPLSKGEFNTEEEARNKAIKASLYQLANYIRNGNDKLNNDFKAIQKLMKENPRITQLINLGLKHNANDDSYEGMGFTVTGNSIENDSDEEWQNQIDRISEYATSKTPQRGLSLTTIEGLDISKVAEFKNLEKETVKLIKANPIIQVTDKETYEKAKKNRATMLKSCTAIDSKEGLAAITRKAFDTVKKTFDNFLIDKIAGERRKHYNTQDEIIKAYEKAEEDRKEAERTQALQRVNERKQLLHDAGMVFNGASYSIGNIHVMPSQLESFSDDEINAVLDQAKTVKSDADRIAELERELAAARGSIAPLTGDNLDVPLPPEQTPELTQGKEAIAVAPPISKEHPYGYEPNLVFVPATEPGALMDFDIAHARFINSNPIPEAFIQCRAYFIMGVTAANIANGAEMERIFRLPADVEPSKPEQLKQLCKNLKNG